MVHNYFIVVARAQAEVLSAGRLNALTSVVCEQLVADARLGRAEMCLLSFVVDKLLCAAETWVHADEKKTRAAVLGLVEQLGTVRMPGVIRLAPGTPLLFVVI